MPPLTGVGVNVTDVLGHIELLETPILTEGVTVGTTVTVADIILEQPKVLVNLTEYVAVMLGVTVIS